MQKAYFGTIVLQGLITRLFYTFQIEKVKLFLWKSFVLGPKFMFNLPYLRLGANGSHQDVNLAKVKFYISQIINLCAYAMVILWKSIYSTF